MSSSASPSSPEVLREAATWITRLKAPDVGEQDHRELIAWLKRSPVHVRHYLDLVSLDVELADRALFENMPLDGLRQESGNNILPWAASNAFLEPPASSQPRTRRRRWLSGVAAAAVAAIAIALILGARPDRYHSAIGELRSIVLDDGSVVTLNTQSEVKVRYSDQSRMVELVRGEALFRVARRQNLPFRVSVDGTVVEALGTAFNIYRRPDGAVVTVVEGRIAVRPPDAAGAELSAGEQMEIAPNAAVRRLDSNEIARVTTWTQRRLTFDQTPVREVVSELNRYNREQLVVEDPELARRPITGAFESNDLESFILFLRREAGASVRAGAGGTRRLTAAASARD